MSLMLDGESTVRLRQENALPGLSVDHRYMCRVILLVSMRLPLVNPVFLLQYTIMS